MPSPFPGMDPYLEHPLLWPDVHNSLIAWVRRDLARALRPRYFVALEERTYLAEPEGLVLVGVPDVSVHGREMARMDDGAAPAAATATATALAVEVPVPDRLRETYLEVRSFEGGEVVTVLELLSPSNKRAGEGRLHDLAKRMATLGTRTHLVEIDLLRAGEPMPVGGAGSASGYRILVSRGDRRPQAQLYRFGVRDRIPCVSLPLRPGDREPDLDLDRLLRELYDDAGYDLRLRYGADPVPPLASADRDWAAGLLRQAGLRP